MLFLILEIYSTGGQLTSIPHLPYFGKFQAKHQPSSPISYPPHTSVCFQLISSFPPFTTHLTLSVMFNQLIGGHLPLSLTHLTWTSFQHPLHNLPSSLILVSLHKTLNTSMLNPCPLLTAHMENPCSTNL
jgi:hypothetical protein